MLKFNFQVMQSTKNYCINNITLNTRYLLIRFIRIDIPNETQYFSLNYDCSITFYTDIDTIIVTNKIDRLLYTDLSKCINCVFADHPIMFLNIHMDGITIFLDTHLFNKPLSCPIYSGYLEESIQIPTLSVPQPLLIKDDYSLYLTKELFEYQKYNVQWMMNIEQGHKTITQYDIIDFLRVELDGYKFYQHCDTKNLVPHCIEQTLDKRQYKINGGILADDTGLGKTVTAIALVLSTLNDRTVNEECNRHIYTNCTVILCPKNIIGQWYDMILEFVKDNNSLSICKITSITNFRRLTSEIICNLDILLIPYQFLLGKSYKKFKTIGTFSLEQFKFKRLIADEFHEFNSISLFENMKFKFKWLLSASPFSKYKVGYMIPYIRVLFENYSYNINLDHSFIKTFIDKMMRKNTVDSIKERLVLPTIKKVLVKLYQTRLEKILYLDKLGDYKEMIKLCTSIYASDAKEVREHYEPLEQMTERVRVGYLKKISELKIELTKLKDKISDAEQRWDEINDPQLELARRLKFQRLDKSVKTCNERITISEQRVLLLDSINDPNVKLQCPICYEDIENMAMTSCGHIFCNNCMNGIIENKIDNITCPVCRETLRKNDIGWSELEIDSKDELRNKWGTKISWILEFCRNLLPESHVIIFSQYNKVLKVIETALADIGIDCQILKGAMSSINKKIQLYRSSKTKILLMSLETCNSGMNLPETTDIILVDTVNNVQSEATEQQAIGRAFRLGNEKKVTVHKLVMFNTVEERNYFDGEVYE